jgi:hypothetical protein
MALATMCSYHAIISLSTLKLGKTDSVVIPIRDHKHNNVYRYLRQVFLWL